MGTVVSGGRVVVVKCANGVQATTYKDEVEAVVDMLNNGSLGGGCSYGCEEHSVALALVSNRILEIRAAIDEQARRELENTGEPDEA
jgi:hypothetical protein